MSHYLARCQATREALALSPGAAFMTWHLPSIRYLTGFSGSNATLTLTSDSVFVATDGRYRDQIAQEAPGVEVVITRASVEDLLPVLRERRVIVDEQTSIKSRQQLVDHGLKVEAIPDPVAVVRKVKDSEEQASIARACKITAQALADIAEVVSVGDSEVTIARRLEARFAERGAQDRAFPSIVASGPNSAIPHHRAGTRPLSEGDLLVVDCGALVDGYHADMTRTFVVGAPPQDWQVQIHETVARAQVAGIEALKPGVQARRVDAAARAVIDDAGFGEAFSHGTGHGVGLEIHEAPMLSAASSEQIPADSVVTVEPGIYLPERGGVRIEDSVLVGERIQVLTESARGLTRVG